MPSLTEMVTELERVKARASAILEQHKTTGLTAEKDLEVTALMTRAGELKQSIAIERAVEEKKKDLANLDDFLNKPEYKVPRAPGDGDESDERKMLQRAGWEFKGGLVLAPTSLGTHVEMFTEEVLFGEIPTDDQDQATFYKTTRAAFKPEYRRAYEKMIRMSARMPAGMSPLSLMTGAEQKALSEGLDQSGGFLVPPDVQAEVLARVAQKAVFRRHARVQTTNRDVLKWPTVQAAAATESGLAAGGGSIFSSGFVGSWVGEVPSQADKDPVFGEFDVPIRKLRVMTKLGNDFISDAAVNVLAFLGQNGATNMALVEDQAFFNGIGGLQPMGILNATTLPAGIDVEGSTTDTISNTTSAAGSAPKLVDVCYALPPQYLEGAVWFFRRAIEGKIRKLVDFQARFLWPPYAGSTFGATPRELLGYPIENSDFMPTDGTNANKVVLFGSLMDGYIIGQRAQITSTVLRERYADTDQTGIILWERVGGDLWNGDAVRVGIV